ncbi:hypothetical protein [Maribellus mangrovi]|uniref:hypothetical protein n=1 Tax=Maribellus mangrovi TaxID=3133146 RepID=UPI0030EC40B4
MNLRRTKSKFNFSWIIVIALLILLYSSYFLLFIPKQEMRVTERGFRILEEYAENIHKKKDYYDTHLKNYSTFYVLNTTIDSLSVAFENNATIDSQAIANVIENLDTDIELQTDKASLSYERSNKGKYVAFPTSIKSTLEDSLQIKETLSDKFHSALVPIKVLMEGLKFDGLFENIALLDSSEVIHNSNGSVVNDISNFEALRIDTVSKTQGGVFTELQIQGMKTHVMILPIMFLDRKFYLAGMIQDPDYRQKTRTINNQFITIFGGILLLLLICMPILKIAFINRKERLNVKDTYNTTVSIIVGTSLLVLLFIGTMKYYVVDRNEANTRINNISHILSANIERELHHVFNLAKTVIRDKDKCYHKMHSYLSSSDYYTVDKSIYHDSIPYNEILFMSDEGKAVKAVTRTAFSNLVQLELGKRNYFKNVKDAGKSWSCNSQEDPEFEAFFIESIKSYNTGSKETAISFRLAEPIKTSKGTAPYMAITTHLPSLYDQILPKDVAFMVINEKGDVMYHSNQNKILHENFLVECNYAPLIAGGINYRTIEQARITYNERQWLAQIVPLDDLPLYHITLIDLQYLDNKNTRMYLFTFYFILITFICVVIGMQIMQRFGSEKTFMKSKNWSFDWLLYRRGKREGYLWVLLIQVVLVLLQVVLSILVYKPIGVLIIQLILISSGGIFAYQLLNKKQELPVKRKLKPAMWISLVIIALLMLLLTGMSLTGLIATGILLLLLLPLTLIVFFDRIKETDLSKIWVFNMLSGLSTRVIYTAYMFTWLLSLSVVPVVIYYYSIKHQENVLSRKAEMIHLAKSNLEHLRNHDEHESNVWARASNGSNIDGYRIAFEDEFHKGKESEQKVYFDASKPGLWNGLLYRAYAYLTNINYDILYRGFKSPLTKDDYMMALLQSSNKRNDWSFDQALVYTSPGLHGTVKVWHVPNVKQSFKKILWRVVILVIPVILWLLTIWFVFYFLSQLVLGSVIDKWKYQGRPIWRNVVDNKEINRILLVVFDGRKYYKKLDTDLVKKISAQELLKTDVADLLELPKKKKKIWITGLGEYLLQHKKMETLLPKLNELLDASDRKIIIEMPYDLDYIEEYFEELVTDGRYKAEEEIEIINYESELKHLFRRFYRFTGSIDKDYINDILKELHKHSRNPEGSEEELLADAHLLKLQYSHIWNNLSHMEKLILFDLADDGMMNLKNRFLINRLKLKGLINLDPAPEIFTSSFQYFLKYSVNQEEINSLEQRLSKEGKWKNTRYLILLLLIPLVAFMFISQGTSVERVVGILTGVIALFSGAIKIMDTSWFNMASKSS